MTLRRFSKTMHKPVRAIQITLPDCQLHYQKWGGSQRAKTGDWIVTNGDNSYTVECSSFRDSYRCLYGDWYLKVAPVWAEQATAPGRIETREGQSSYSAGDYLVYNQPNRIDGYTVPKQEFENNYRLLGDETMAMSAEDYLQTRVDDQIDWYDKKASFNQAQYKRLQLVAIVFGAAIPLLTVISFKEWETPFRFLIALLGSAIAVVSGVSSLNKYQENWVKYRACAEALRREKYHFLTRTGGYSENDAGLLVSRCEALMAGEQSEWMNTALPQQAANPSASRAAPN